MSEIEGSIRRLMSAPIGEMDPTNPNNDRNHTQNYIIEAVNAEKQLLKLIHSKGLLHIDVHELYRKACSTYEKIILNDHELAELQDVEYSLWKLHYKLIDEYRNRFRGSSVTKECVKPETLQNEITAQNKNDSYLEGFKSFLSEATGFYHQLIKKIKISYGLPEELLFFNEGGFSNSADSTRMHRYRFSCHRCLVCLGDLARYRQLYGNPDGQTQSWSVAARHYLNASKMWPDSGNPHNQLAVLAIYVGDELLALYHCIRSLAVKEPFPDAWDNLILLFEKNRSSHLHSLSNVATFNFFKPDERSIVQMEAQSSGSFSNCQLRETIGDDLTEETELWSLIVRMISCFYAKPSLEDFPCIFSSTMKGLEILLLLDDARLKFALESYQHMDVARKGPFRVLQIVSVLIFTIHTLNESSKLQKAELMKYMQQVSLIQQAFTSTFIFMGRLVNRSMMAHSIDCSPLLPAVLIFVEWLVDMLDQVEKYAADGKCASAIGYFFNAFVDLLNRFEDEGSVKSPAFHVLWEDDELRGFSPIFQSRGPLDIKNHQETRILFEDRNECQVRICRIFVAAMKIVNKSNGSHKWMFHEKTRRKFYTTEPKRLPGRREQLATELPNHSCISTDIPPFQEATTEVLEVRVSEAEKKNLDVHRSSLVEEEEVILFKPLTRYNSAPLHLPGATSSSAPSEEIWDLGDPSGEFLNRRFSLDLRKNETRTDVICGCSDVTSSSNKTIWQATIPEDSAMDSFAEATDSPRFRALSAQSDEPPSVAGPPSLSAWVVNKDSLGTAGSKGFKDTSKQVPEHAEDVASAYLTGLSIGRTEASQQDVKSTSSPPASRLRYGSTYEGDSLNYGQSSSPISHQMPPPYMTPVPSAPLLPDDATWFNANLFNHAEHRIFEDVKEFFPVASQVNNYSNFPGTLGPANFSPNIPRFSDGYTPYSSSHWLHQNQVNLDSVPPDNLYMPTTPGRFQGHDASKTSPSALHPTRHLEDLPTYPGFISGAKQQRLFPAYPGPSPYQAARDLRSEQQLLLRYLKEKEWHLQQEAQLRGAV